jgi:alpha-galactosidase
VPLVQLRSDNVGLVIDARGPRLPAVVHWGAPLGDLAPPELEALASAATPPRAEQAPDARLPVTLLPESSAGYPGRDGLRGHRDGKDWTTAFTLMGIEATDRAATFTASDEPARLLLTTELELSGGGMLRGRHRLRNQADEPYVLDGLALALLVPPRASELLDLTGRWGRERHPQRHRFQLGAWSRESRRGRTGHDATIGLLAGTAGFGFGSGEVWALHVAWSGNHVTYAERLPTTPGLLGGGELLLPGEVVLASGEEYAMPWVYAAYSDQGIDGLSAVFHDWLRARAVHPVPRRPRPVILNTWEAVYFDHDLQRLRALADTAAGIGVERFVLDDGWFRHRRDDTAGLGDWYVDEQVWPEGLHPLTDHVRSLGMEFGLWVEPEMVNPDSDLFRAHPDWALAPAPDRLPLPWRNQQVLDVANPAAYAYLLQRLDALLTEYDIAYLKWDHNRDILQGAHGGRAGVHAQTLAVYRLMDQLRVRHPGLEIESCASGGGRVDLEILQRTERVWASDSTDALERQHIQLWTGVFLPPELLGNHVSAPVNHQTGRATGLPLRLATALFGHFGIEWNITTATPEERALLAQAIAFYKQHRGWLHAGRTVRADHPDPSALLHGLVAADGSQALYCFAQFTTSVGATPGQIVLPGLDPSRRYQLHHVHAAGSQMILRGTPLPPWLTGTPPILTGSTLGHAGVQLPALPPASALLLHAQAVE